MGRKKQSQYVFYKGLQPKNTFASKVKSAFRKAMLVAAAGTAVGGYHHYGTGEEMTVTVTQVQQQADGAPTLIHTDKGTFVNTATWLHLKGDGRTQEIGNTVRAGMRVNVRVYGLHPSVLGFSPDDLGLHRNIVAATAISGTPRPATPPPAPTPPPAVTAPRAPEVGMRTQLGVVADSNLARAQTCADIATLDELRDTNPQIYRDLAILERLPLTGSAMFAQVTHPDAFLRSCLTPYNENSGASGQYSNKRLRIMRGMGSQTSFHEIFHARQDLNEDGLNEKMTLRDAAVANALTEATAVAYGLMAEREAKNLGLTLTDNTDTRRIGADDHEGTRAVFDAAYQTAFAEHTGLAASAREAKALEAGGRAVVRTLMLGDDDNWLRAYSQLVVHNLGVNQHIYGRNTGSEAGYAQTRKNLFESQGAVSATINIIPREFVGDQAERHITRSFELMGIRVAPANTGASYGLRRGV